MKPGDTAQYSFELLDTLAGGTINAPGRFSVSIAYKSKQDRHPVLLLMEVNGVARFIQRPYQFP